MAADLPLPLVSIGVPAFNAERYIQRSLDSLLAQDYPNLELIISDNASVDRTSEICRECAARDDRIRYYRNDSNQGAVRNFNRLVELATGRYFMWAADHDLWDPAYVSGCVSILEAEPEVVLAYSRTVTIDPDDNQLALASDEIDTRGMSVIQRYKLLIWSLHWCNMVYGVFRREALARTGGFRNVWGSDYVLLAELALYGAYAQLPTPMFYRRENRKLESPEVYRSRVLAYLDPAIAASKSGWSDEDLVTEMGRANLQAVVNAPINLFDKLRALILTAVCCRLRFGMRWPVLSSIEKATGRIFPKRFRRRVLLLATRAANGNKLPGSQVGSSSLSGE